MSPHKAPIERSVLVMYGYSLRTYAGDESADSWGGGAASQKLP